MSLRINSEAPNFTAETTQGTIDFHRWIGDGWAILFSHPKDFTPVCTTELGYMAKIKNEFDKRGVKLLGISVDSVDDHKRWKNDIKDVTGAEVREFLFEPTEELQKYLADFPEVREAFDDAHATAATAHTATTTIATRFPIRTRLLRRYCCPSNAVGTPAVPPIS